MDVTGVLKYYLYYLFVFVVVNRSVQTSLISTKVDLCGPISELVLDQFDESSATIAFAPNEYTSICKLKITAPETHVIYMNIVETIPQELLNQYRRSSRSESCPLNVYQHGNVEPVWADDPCSHQSLPDIDLLRPEVILEWTPPADPSQAKGKKIVVTAVGRGDVCKDSLQHTCMTIGYEPLFCVSKYLLCDGSQNCPRGATKNDEDDRLCKITWKIFFKQFKNPEVNEKILNVLLSKTTMSPKVFPIWHDWTYRNEEVTTLSPPTTTESQTNIESLSAALSHYGPWGYILLGLLICGTVLMFCGVWECFRKPKPTSEAAQIASANTNTTTTTTTVLIIQEEEDNSPPNYDDLEPPSYSTLFPNVKEEDSVAGEIHSQTQQQNLEDRRDVHVSNENNIEQEFSASAVVDNINNSSNNLEDTRQVRNRCESTINSSENASSSSVSVADSNPNSSDLTTNNENNNLTVA